MKPVEIALYNTMKASTALTSLIGGTVVPRIYNTLVAQGASFPAVVFQKLGGGHVPDSPRENLELTYQVKVLSGSLEAAEDIDMQLTAALDRHDLQVSSGYSDYACWRIGHVHFVEGLLGGSLIYHVGGLYRILVSGTV